jgi:hypothetical protein
MAQLHRDLEGASGQPYRRPELREQLRERTRDVDRLIMFEIVSEQPFPDDVHHLGDDQLGGDQAAAAPK